MSMAEPFLPAHEPSDDDRARDTAFDDDDVLIEPDTAPAEAEPAAEEDEDVPAFRTPVAGDRLTADELAEELDDEAAPL
ncbi:hypothetical protein [Rathayibacter sp. VKM Ac-2801]|uniref:hypothetical protein n=1 Tax=Rathayibacter sp. VKM Ac-2801 TaxID=2609255 RepID=UPI00131F7039|nr:hypothetical protein [Rathayibacter sp. VKM Ac-2801]QHC69727.1 hypothetical protein GSU45_04590 [Rathayibacter sp. VKM Ac-2801]